MTDTVQGLRAYLTPGGAATGVSAAATATATTAAATAGVRRKRVLVFTDSRGQHKPRGCNHAVFAERLAADTRLEVDLVLCPMKWTTLLDFLSEYPPRRLAGYDHVIVYGGIVDWSPRRLSSAVSDLYNNRASANTDNLTLNTRDYSKKVVNCKKPVFDEVFGASAMAEHFAGPLPTVFEGEPTANMYSLEMAKRSLLPRLDAIDNLIFVSANRLVRGWKGDFPRERPQNIDLTHAYSDLFSEGLERAKVVDLRQWSDAEVKLYTCDNIHLTQQGSNWIYDRLLKAMDMTEPAPAFVAPRTPERITAAKKPPLLAAAKRSDFLASLVIGVRLDVDAVRMSNLKFLLAWLDYYYGDLFDVLLIEQDSVPRLDLNALGAKPWVRHEFLYNPSDYNRGWGYNVAVAHFCKEAEVVALLDTDVLTCANFVREVIDCHGRYDAISPYRNIYYTDAGEVRQIERTRRLDTLGNPRHIKNPVTVAGGILIIKRDVFLRLRGFEQYIGYGCEDRALDVTLYNHVESARIRIANEAYPHLHHASDSNSRAKFKQIYAHLVANYHCQYHSSLKPHEFIHRNCHHAAPTDTQRLMDDRAGSFADFDLYRRGPLTANGLLDSGKSVAFVVEREAIFPPEFRSLDDYLSKELYANAPEPDADRLASLYNKFKGRRCFIIGNGPSLNNHDLSLLKDEYSFGVNSFYYKTRETGFLPTFYVVEDSSVMKENIEEICAFDAPYKFFPTNYRSLHPEQPNTYFFRMNRGFYEKSSPNYVVPRFSTDASKVLYCGQSVTYINLQLAYFLGFTEVYLIGMDFSYVIPESHKRSGDVLLSDTDDPNHFHKDYFGKGKTWKDPKLDRVALNYRQARLVYEATGRQVFNATIGGSLEVFPRVDYNALLHSPERAPALPAQTFAAANVLMREGHYAQAFSAYVALAQVHGDMAIYKRSAVEACVRAGEAGQSCTPTDVAFIRGLMFNIV